jgi:hypothetical protein
MGDAICETLQQCCSHLENAEEIKDSVEQDQLHRSMQMPAQSPAPVPVPDQHQIFDDCDMDMGAPSSEDELNDEDEDDLNDDDCDKEDESEVNPYLSTADAGSGSGTGSSSRSGSGSAFSSGGLGTYVRVVHSNGLHTIAMISCQCQGENILPLDLFAAQLLPASLKRIKTLFTSQVLDMFRLSNLELKASAYQFYQLLRRLTNPIQPGEVINLYREFRRMSRLWRWMKKLKWAGYAGSTKTINEVGTGELAIYCPACPQPGINIPDDWMDDPARYV